MSKWFMKGSEESDVRIGFVDNSVGVKELVEINRPKVFAKLTPFLLAG